MPEVRREGIGIFHGKASFADLRRVCWSQARELRSDVVNNVEVAVGPVVIPQTKIGAHCLVV